MADLSYDDHDEVLPDSIDCYDPPAGLNDYQQAIMAACRAANPPSSTQRQAITSALNEIGETLGCEAIASAGSSFLSGGTLMIFSHSAGVYGDRSIGGYGGDDLVGIDVMISDIWFGNQVRTQDLDGSAVTLNLNFALVHEIEHQMGRSHLPGSAFELSPDTYRCAGVT